MNIYVGNLSYEVTQEDLTTAFEAFGAVDSVKIIKDNFTGRSKGFGFVEMPVENEAQSAIEGLDGKELKGRSLKVNAARPRSEGRQGGARSGGSGQSRRGHGGPGRGGPGRGGPGRGGSGRSGSKGGGGKSW